MAECGCKIERQNLNSGVSDLVIVHCPKHAEVDNLVAALAKMLAVIDESEGVTGWHLNDAVAEWGEFEFINDMRDAAARGGAS